MLEAEEIYLREEKLACHWGKNAASRARPDPKRKDVQRRIRHAYYSACRSGLADVGPDAPFCHDHELKTLYAIATKAAHHGRIALAIKEGL